MNTTEAPMPIAIGHVYSDPMNAGRFVEVVTLPTGSRPGSMRVIADEVRPHHVGQIRPFTAGKLRAHYVSVERAAPEAQAPRPEPIPGTAWRAPTGTRWTVLRSHSGPGGTRTLTVQSDAGAIRYLPIATVESWEPAA